MTGAPSRWLLLGLLAALPLGAAGLRPVPAVDLSGMEPAVRDQVAAAEQAAAAAARQSGAAAADGFGAAGKIFLIYLLHDAAQVCFDNAIQLAPADRRWSYYAGVAAQNKGELERARDHLRQAALPPEPVPAAICRLGDVELLLGDLDGAEAAYRRALTTAGTTAAAHFGLGRVAMARGKVAIAATQFEATLAVQPTASSVHALLAAAYRRLGRTADAAAQEREYGTRAVDFADPLVAEAAAANKLRIGRLRSAIQELSEGRFAEAEAALHRELELDPADAQGWLNLGTAQENLGKTDAATASYRRAIELDPGNAKAHYDLGTLLVTHGARPQGIDQLLAALRLRPAMIDARFNLVTALAQEGRFSEAQAQCNELLGLAGQDPQAKSLCAEVARQVPH